MLITGLSLLLRCILVLVGVILYLGIVISLLLNLSILVGRLVVNLLDGINLFILVLLLVIHLLLLSHLLLDWPRSLTVHKRHVMVTSHVLAGEVVPLLTHAVGSHGLFMIERRELLDLLLVPLMVVPVTVKVFLA